jgi:hypothetical protein
LSLGPLPALAPQPRADQAFRCKNK